jgi:hypothetical protein
MKLSAYLLGLGALASAISIDVTPVLAQVAGGNDNGSGREAITAPLAGSRQQAYAAQSQSAVDRFSQSLTATSIGDVATFDLINGGAPGPFIAALLPSGVATDSATGKAAANLASTMKGMRAGNGNINAAKLNAAVVAYNEYIKAMVGELGPDRAISSPLSSQKAVQGLLSQLIQVANQSAPTAPPATKQ